MPVLLRSPQGDLLILRTQGRLVLETRVGYRRTHQWHFMARTRKAARSWVARRAEALLEAGYVPERRPGG